MGGKGFFVFAHSRGKESWNTYSKRDNNNCQLFGHRPIASPARGLVQNLIDVVLVRDR